MVVGAAFRSGLTYFYLRRLVAMQGAQLLAATGRSGVVAAWCLCGVAALQLWQPQAHALAQVLVAALLCGLIWLAGIHYVRHPLSEECTLAARKALALLHR